MSGGKGHIDSVDIAKNDTTDVLAPKVRKLEVVADEEIYYPVVTIIRAEEIEVKFLKEAEEASGVATTNEEIVFESEKEADVEPREINDSTTIEMISAVEKTKESRRRSGWGSKVGTFAVAAVAIIAVVLVGMRLAGFKMFTVMSGSMEPDLPVGAMVYVRPVDYQSLKVGDVISYVANDDKTIVTHRIVDIEVDKNDVWRFKTKGDANNTPDGNLVHYKNVLGTPAIIIPQIGYFAYNIQRPPGIYITLVVGTLLLAWTFLPGTLEERRKTARKRIV